MNATYVILIDVLVWPLENLVLVDANGDLLTGSIGAWACGKIRRELKRLSVSLAIILAVVKMLHLEVGWYSKMNEWMYVGESEEKK